MAELPGDLIGSVAVGDRSGLRLRRGVRKQTIRVAPTADLEEVAEHGPGTAGNTEVALCTPGDALPGAGFALANPGNRKAT